MDIILSEGQFFPTINKKVNFQVPPTYQFDGNPRLILFQFTPQQTASLSCSGEASLWDGSLTTDPLLYLMENLIEIIQSGFQLLHMFPWSLVPETGTIVCYSEDWIWTLMAYDFLKLIHYSRI